MKMDGKNNSKKGYNRILDVLDILEEIEGPFTTNMIVKEMKKIDEKIRYETIKKYLDLIYEISNRGVLERSFEKSEDIEDSNGSKKVKKLNLWNYRSDKKEDAKKLYMKILELLKLNSLKEIEVEELRKEIKWSSKRLENTIRELIKERRIQFESNKIILERSWLNFEEWILKNTINPKESNKCETKKQIQLDQKNIHSPKIKKIGSEF